MAGAVQQAALLLPCQEKEIKKMVPGWLGYAVKTKIEEETHLVFLQNIYLSVVVARTLMILKKR